MGDIKVNKTKRPSKTEQKFNRHKFLKDFEKNLLKFNEDFFAEWEKKLQQKNNRWGING